MHLSCVLKHEPIPTRKDTRTGDEPRITALPIVEGLVLRLIISSEHR